MALYRAKSNLDAGKTKIRRGEIFQEEKLGADALRILEKLGRVSRVSTPPVEVLPGWKKRAEKLLKMGAMTVEDFLGMPDGELAKGMRVSQERIRDWKREALGWLQAPEEKKR